METSGHCRQMLLTNPPEINVGRKQEKPEEPPSVISPRALFRRARALVEGTFAVCRTLSLSAELRWRAAFHQPQDQIRGPRLWDHLAWVIFSLHLGYLSQENVPMFSLGGWKASEEDVLEGFRIPCPSAQAAVLEPAAQQQCADEAAPCSLPATLCTWELRGQFPFLTPVLLFREHLYGAYF